MRVTIQHIIEPMALGAYVGFSTLYGNGRSFFSSPKVEENQAYDVEIDINDDFIWNQNITPSDGRAPSIYFESGKLYVTAELIFSADDGCGALKFGDSTILISLTNMHQHLPIFVDVVAEEISLHPTNI